MEDQEVALLNSIEHDPSMIPQDTSRHARWGNLAGDLHPVKR
jgi:hypothetical protein